MHHKPEDLNFSLYVSYSQVAVYDASLENPFNSWTPELVHQGFTWREGATSFRTINEDGTLHVAVRIVDQHHEAAETVRGIRVPFTVPSNGEIEVGSITGGKSFLIPAGDYSLFFETWTENDEMWCMLTFCTSFSAAPEIFKCDDVLTPAKPLQMGAQPA